ncbi:hypothetical protein MJ585_26060 [Klebsiella pneumoniae]|nr:hypothetical protein MJ585_26060 [Klebsiella pneumoniae]
MRIRTDYCSEPLGYKQCKENYKILVVDDDMRLRALLERYLTEQGFQVRSVANAGTDGSSVNP